jgi:tyrosyl-tRNA synthetase
MSRFARCAQRSAAQLAATDISRDSAVRELIELSLERRKSDLSDLSPQEQAALIGQRCQQLQPSTEALAQRMAEAANKGRTFVAKFGIDPTGAEVHLGHAVPMVLLSRFQRMGHQVVFIVGDVTAKIGDPSGRSDERPALTDDDIASNLATYKDQVAPFFDFSRAQFRYNGDWLRLVTLPRLIEIAAHVPLSMSLQREDFRQRLSAGHSLSVAELLYSVAMALDSVEVECDIEVGGIDQYLNMQMCRRVMQICGQQPELVAAVPLIEGTDGSGAKMSKSKGNYVPLTASPGEVFGKLMSVPDRLVWPYFRALTEWSDQELAVLQERLDQNSLHPVDLKKVLAGDVTAALHGADAAMKVREEFAAQFARRHFGDVDDLPVVKEAGEPLMAIMRALGFVSSNSDARRAAQQNAVRLVFEPRSGAGQAQVVIAPDELAEALGGLLVAKFGEEAGRYFVKVGRKLARVERHSANLSEEAGQGRTPLQ